MSEHTVWTCDGCGEERNITRNKQGDWHVIRIQADGFQGYPTNAGNDFKEEKRYHLCPNCTRTMYDALRPHSWSRATPTESPDVVMAA